MWMRESFVALGERRLKGFVEPVPVFRFEWRELNSPCRTWSH